MIYPTIHINGDRKETLLEEHCNALDAIRAAQESLPRPNGRNYYPQGPQAISEAIDQTARWYAALEQVRQEIEAIAIHISDQH